jgi:glutamine synthetase
VSTSQPQDPQLAERALASLEELGTRYVLLQFVDLFGVLKSVSLPARRFRSVVEHGEWFDGSSVDGFARVLENDMYLAPDLGTFRLAPAGLDGSLGAARVMCNLRCPDGETSAGDSRAVLQRAIENLCGARMEFHIAAEVEFFLFGAAAGPRPTPSDRAGYFDQTRDTGAAIREEIVEALQAQGVEVEGSHHEVSPGQHEIDLASQPALLAADAVVLLRDAVRVTAARHGLRASFMPKPLDNCNGSGMHSHQGLLDPEGRNLFHEASDAYGLSSVARHFVAGLLVHAPALAAVTAPTVNSYKRLVAGFEAPTHICWAHSSRAALVRVPQVSRAAAPATTVELRCPDPSCNPYLAFAAMLIAGMDGVERRLPLPPPMEEEDRADGDLLAERRLVGSLPRSLGEALDELREDDAIVDGLGPTLVERFVEAKRMEWEQYRAHVSDWELERYLHLH